MVNCSLCVCGVGCDECWRRKPFMKKGGDDDAAASSRPHKPQTWRPLHSQVHLVLHTLRVVDIGMDKPRILTRWRGKPRGGHAFSPPQNRRKANGGGSSKHTHACPSALEKGGWAKPKHRRFGLTLLLCKTEASKGGLARGTCCLLPVVSLCLRT